MSLLGKVGVVLGDEPRGGVIATCAHSRLVTLIACRKPDDLPEELPGGAANRLDTKAGAEGEGGQGAARAAGLRRGLRA